MKSTVAKDRCALKKRVGRFCAGLNRHAQVRAIIDELLKEGDVILFGGAIRDIALYGVRGFRSDVDLVFVGSVEYLFGVLEPLGGVKTNRFGGARLQVSRFMVDIWPIEMTWAFRYQHVPFTSVTDLRQTVITSWEAAMYSLGTQTLYCSDGYVSELSSGYMDLVLKENPNPLGSIVRVLRNFAKHGARVPSNTLFFHLVSEVKRYSLDEILEHERSSFRDSYLDESLIKLFSSKSSEDVMAGWMIEEGRQCDLFNGG